MVIAPLVRGKPSVPYDPFADFEPVAGLGNFTMVLVAGPDVPAKNLTELIDYIKALGVTIADTSVVVVTGSGTSGDSVKLFNGRQVLGSATVDGTGHWSARRNGARLAAVEVIAVLRSFDQVSPEYGTSVSRIPCTDTTLTGTLGLQCGIWRLPATAPMPAISPGWAQA